jgi:hypothetical protein
MKISSAHAGPTVIDKPTAWACALTNAVTLPGLGTIAGGRKIGYVQAACALLGFALSLGGLLAHLRLWYDTGEIPEGFTRGLLVAVAGMLLFGFAWLWALASSIRLHRQATEPPPAPKANGAARSTLPPRL